MSQYDQGLVGTGFRETSRVTWHVERNIAAEAVGLVLYRIDREVGAWRIFAADTSSAGMTNGTATPLLAGDSPCATAGYGRPRWLRPDAGDIAKAAELLRARESNAGKIDGEHHA